MKKIVTIGGGTGSYTVLSGLKNIEDFDLTAVVSMADDGGSTGVLRDELGVLPPGDVRQCLVALSLHTDIVRKLISYRFEEGGLSGHSFGNLFLAALEKVTGDFATGVEVASEILKVKGRVLPVTKDKADLVVTLGTGEVLEGENSINHANLQKEGVISIGYARKVVINPHALDAIIESDCIIIGPGNYYCSIFPIFLVDGFKEAIQKTKGKIVVPVNLTNKQGHTLGWNMSDYIKDIEKHIGRSVDVVISNNENPSEEQVAIYKLEEGDGVMVVDDISGDMVLRVPLLSHGVIEKNKSDVVAQTRSFIRHDKDKLAQAIRSIL